MMFIEHTPLEDNLQYILRSSALLAHDQERGSNGPASQLHLERQQQIPCGAISDHCLRQAGQPATEITTCNGGSSFCAKTLSGQQEAEATGRIKSGEEEYELFDVFDEDINTHPQEEKGVNRKHPVLAGSKDLISVREDLEDTSSEIFVEIEDKGNNFEYILSRVQTSNCSRNKIQRESATRSHHRTSQLRPIPAAIPIQKQVPRPLRILNGILPPLGESYHTTNTSRTVRQNYENGFVEAVEDDTLIADTEGNEQFSQMSILTKLRKLLNFNFSTSSASDTEERTRKRRLDHKGKADPHQIKYRKITNNFPELITHSLEDDDLDVIPQYPVNRNNNIEQNYFPRSKNYIDIKERASLNSMESPKMRKSIFDVPEQIHKVVKNTAYADIEFSDDDELQLVKGFGIDKDADNAGISVLNASRKPPAVRNIPVRDMRSEERHRYLSKPPPPLIEARTGNLLLPPAAPQIDLLCKSTAQQILQQSKHTAIVNSNLMAPPLASSSSSSVASAGGYNNFNSKVRPSPWSTNAHSILAQEKESDEREKYRQLLEQMVPRLYGVENEHAQAIKVYKNKNNRELGPLRSGFFVENSRNLSTADSTRKPLPSRNDTNNSYLKRPPLSSTINLADDYDDDEVTLTGVMQLNKSGTRKDVTLTVDIDDDEISEIIDLDEEEKHIISACTKLKSNSSNYFDLTKDGRRESAKGLPYVEPVNTLQDRFKTSPHLKENWLEKWQLEWNQKKKNRLREVHEATKIVEKLAIERRTAENEIQERLKRFQIIDPDLLVIDDFPEPAADAEPEFISLTADDQARIKAAVCGPSDQVLITKFNLNITRRDIHTLLGLNWLNDEVINFYMNLLTERGDKKHDSHGLPRVYAMNTFFVPRLMQAGHSGVKRWTRKVDIFAKDIIPVPVHVGGVHWCMAIIHLKNRSIKYYDSMGTPNPNVLRSLEQYLKDESMDKRRQPFDTSQFLIESIQEVPRQMNGSDCGVFSCMFAEYITRNKEINFSQQNMEYFRHKMILEIVQGELLQ